MVEQFKERQVVNNIVPSLELASFQNIAVQKVLLNKRLLISSETGTGKTIIAGTIFRALLNKDPEKKNVFVIIHNSMQQALLDLYSLTEVPTMVFSGTGEDLRKLRKNWKRLGVVILTYECFRDEYTIQFLYNHLMEIESIILDECHHVSNWQDSSVAFMLRSFCKWIPYVVGLTATPATSSEQQFYSLLNLIDRNISSHRIEDSSQIYEHRYMAINREDFSIKGNYKVTVVPVSPMPYQIGEVRGIVSRTFKGQGATAQAETLISVILKKLQENKSVIIYVNLHEVRLWIEQYLTAEGIAFSELHGKMTKQELRQESLDRFRSGEVKVFVTSVAESLNIESDVVIFYEFTTKLKQVLGRAHRGLAPKELELIFILTRDSAEIDYFMKYIYKRSVVLQKLLQRDYTEFINAGEEILKLHLGIADDSVENDE